MNPSSIIDHSLKRKSSSNETSKMKDSSNESTFKNMDKATPLFHAAKNRSLVYFPAEKIWDLIASLFQYLKQWASQKYRKQIFLALLEWKGLV